MEITDNDLRERLMNLGYHPPPITSTSRNILLKKLKALETNSTMESVIDSNECEEIEEENVVFATAEEITATDGIRHRSRRSSFFPKNVGMYSRCYVKNKDFWDRTGTIGTFLILLLATGAVFVVFKFIGDWSDRRYRSVTLTDAVFPNCKDGGHVRITCIPDTELKFTESNINIVREALHLATLTERCSQSSLKNNNKEFVGMYPIFKDDYVENLLVKKFAFKETESKMLLKNAKVIFKMNPRFDVKVLDDGLIYRNQRLLRSCGYMSHNTAIYTYAIYFITSFAVVWFTYRAHRWVGKLRIDNDEQRRRLIKDISDILKQNQRETGDDFLSVKKAREWLSVANLEPKLWDNVTSYLKEYEANISIEQRILQGETCDVFYLKK